MVDEVMRLSEVLRSQLPDVVERPARIRHQGFESVLSNKLVL